MMHTTHSVCAHAIPCICYKTRSGTCKPRVIAHMTSLHRSTAEQHSGSHVQRLDHRIRCTVHAGCHQIRPLLQASATNVQHRHCGSGGASTCPLTGMADNVTYRGSGVPLWNPQPGQHRHTHGRRHDACSSIVSSALRPRGARPQRASRSFRTASRRAADGSADPAATDGRTGGGAAAAELTAAPVRVWSPPDDAGPASSGILTRRCIAAEAADKGWSTLSGSGCGATRATGGCCRSSSGGTARAQVEPGWFTTAC